MKLGMFLGYAAKQVQPQVELVQRVESLGFDSVWFAEAYGGDAVTTATWALAHTNKIKAGTAIMQVPGRTPACTAMTAMSLSQLSGGRFILGLGASGPQVVEGWHGVSYKKPITRMREYIQIVKAIMAREAPVSYDGEIYQLPLRDDTAVGLGKPLKSILHAITDIPVYTASVTPAGLACAGEVADGAMPLWMNPDRFDIYQTDLERGFAKAGGGKSMAQFDLAPSAVINVENDMNLARAPVKHFLALYIGGMGARKKNFYNDLAAKHGYGDAAVKIQDLYLAGDKEAAAAAVPDDFVDEISLVGPKERIIERAKSWKAAADRGEIGTLMLTPVQPEALDVAAEALL